MRSAISRGLVGMEHLLPVGDVEMCVDTVGSPSEPALLLIGTTVAAWDDELVARLTGRFVIRYDQRDAGRSTTPDPASPPPAGRPPSTPTPPATPCATSWPTPSACSTGSASPARTSPVSRRAGSSR